MATKVINQPNVSAERIDFSKVSGTLPLPNLVEIQTSSFAKFIESGLRDVFNDVYPIVSQNQDLELHYVSCRFDESKYSVEECKNRDML